MAFNKLTGRKISAIIFCFVPLAIIAAQKTVVVRGQVVALDRSEIPNAQVAALPVPSTALGVAGHSSWTSTDSHGQFRLVLPPGRYVIRAKAEQAGYPNPDALLSADPSALFPTISVQQSDISDVVVTLGKKGAVLEGYAYDEQSKTAIEGTKVTLLDPHNPLAIVELTPDKSGHFQFTVPSKPILVSASAPGYETARFANGEPLTLSSGEHRTISLLLHHR